jgi:hypothetical protein
VIGPVLAGLLYDTEMGAPFWFAAALLLLLWAGGRSLPERAARNELPVPSPIL